MSEAMRARVLSFPLTAFTDDGTSLAEAGFRAHLRGRIEAEAGAVFVACGTGEFSALAEGEFRRVLEVAVDEVAGAVPVIAGIGYGWAQALRFARIAEECGVDGALVLPQYLVSAPQDGIREHVERIAGGTELPLILYQRGVAEFQPATVHEVSQLPTVVGLKDGRSHYPSLQLTTLAVDEDFLFFNGALTAELQYRPYASVGVSSYSSAVHAYAPEISNAFFQATRTGDHDMMDRLLVDFFAPLVELRDRVRGYPVALIKAGARLRGQNVGSVRGPLADPCDAHVERLAEITRAGLSIVGAEL
ncbi:MAG: 5-dehydro-4-deoxyglucarate dehydratase [Protaetiibacter sp.]